MKTGFIYNVSFYEYADDPEPKHAKVFAYTPSEAINKVADSGLVLSSYAFNSGYVVGAEVVEGGIL